MDLHKLLVVLIEDFNSKIDSSQRAAFAKTCFDKYRIESEKVFICLERLKKDKYVVVENNLIEAVSESGLEFYKDLNSIELKVERDKRKENDDAGIASFNNNPLVKFLRIASLIIGIIGGILGGIAFFNNKNGIPTDNMVTKEFLKEYTEKFQNEALNHTNSDTLNTHP